MTLWKTGSCGVESEWAKPSAPKDLPTEGAQFRSGYWKALAQDTKEKVSFASNLTH